MRGEHLVSVNEKRGNVDRPSAAPRHPTRIRAVSYQFISLINKAQHSPFISQDVPDMTLSLR